MNIVIVKGDLLDQPIERTLGDGRTVLVGTILTRGEHGSRESVPFSWFEAPQQSSKLAAGTSVVATGRIRRRFFRVAGRTDSLTDLVINRMVRSHHHRRVATAVRNALEPAEDLIAS